jgi:hypothetical protein
MVVVGASAVTPRRSTLAVTALVALIFGTAPTVGDIGSCGSAASLLDESTFAAERKQTDCSRCTGCKLTTHTCANACDPDAGPTAGWPPTCEPLQHDGDVCIRALQAASCADYASFVSDVSPTLPTECDFCRDLPDGGFGFGGDP